MSVEEFYIKNWKQLIGEISALKGKISMLIKIEKEMRRKICNEILEGRTGAFSETKVLHGFKCKATSNTHLSIDYNGDFIEDVYFALTPEEQDAISIKLSVLKSKLKNIDRESEIYQYIIEKPGMPTLEIKE